MAWLEIATGALPAVAGMFTDKPATPTYQPHDYGYGGQVDQIMADAFNPAHQSELYRLANEQAFGNLNRQMANLGIANSSAGVQASRSLSSDLANQYLANEMARRQQALNLAVGYQDKQRRAGMDLYKMAQGDYAYADRDARELVGGIGDIAGAFGRYYGRQQAADQREQGRRDMYAMYGIPFPG